ncbi:Basic helix-loop-helix transcription factor [Heracleum sosnowskyi]|uniref:Basic helix-loop-helix transcription factor n=1 Tax=Heracleum sosnowskyi TaxID=360622 RepID=A0AAD8JBW7_9APIA|nr:Basic helix-loop-helix transcription factor [Heracleum sosnowskyi]
MYTLTGSDSISKELNNLYFSSNFNHKPDNTNNTFPTSNLSRYRSAPTSIFDILLDEVKIDSDLKQEVMDLDGSDFFNVPDMGYVGSGQDSGVTNVDKSFRGFEEVKKNSNLIRQSSSPAGYLSNLVAEIEFGAMGTLGGSFDANKQARTEVNTTASRLSNHVDYSSRSSSKSRFMPHTTENYNEKIGTSCQQNGQFSSGQNREWSSDSTFNGLKRNRDGEVKMLSNTKGLNNQSEASKLYSSGLLHQFSLPSTSGEMETIENLLHFQQDSGVPCRTRAKRGFATHPRSIAERMRRTRISERMKKLQDLFPNMDKQANTADMLDLAVEYIKDLQKEVKTLNETRDRCTCSR